MKLFCLLVLFIVPQLVFAGGNVNVNGGGDRPSPSSIAESIPVEKETIITLPKDDTRWLDLKDRSISKPLPFERLDRTIESNSNLF